MKKLIIIAAMITLANSPQAFAHTGHNTCAKGHTSHNNCGVKSTAIKIIKIKKVIRPNGNVKIVKVIKHKPIRRHSHKPRIIKVNHHHYQPKRVIKKVVTKVVHVHHYQPRKTIVKKVIKRVVPMGNRNIVHKSGPICRN